MPGNTSRKPGTIEPIFYFQFRDGHIELAATDDDARRPNPDADICFVETLAEAYKLDERLLQQEKDRCERETQSWFEREAPVRAAIRSRLYSRIASSSCSEYEKECIRLHIAARNDDQRAKVQQALFQYQYHLWQLGNDDPKAKIPKGTIIRVN